MKRRACAKWSVARAGDSDTIIMYVIYQVDYEKDYKQHFYCIVSFRAHLDNMGSPNSARR